MTDPLDPEASPSLLGPSVRRSLVTGKVYLAASVGPILIYGAILAVVPGNAFIAFPLLVPILAVVGALGSLIVFTNDRLKGVFEYLLAYGISPRSLFVNYLVAGLVLLSIVLAITIPVSLGIYVGTRGAPSAEILELLLTYAVPMSYAAASFALMVGMIWTSLSSPRASMNSPIGMAPLIGIAPPVVTLVAVGVVEAATALPFIAITTISVVLVSAATFFVLGSSARLLRRERLLSPA